MGRRVIELGACDVNGSVRDLVEAWKPSEYIGVDIEKGPGADVVCPAEDLLERFDKESFDVVISTEMLEHVRSWRKVVFNIKAICRPGGFILITTRSYGFRYHGFPYDFWRYELEDMSHIFSDCKILALEKDKQAPGVFIKVQKPLEFEEKNLTTYPLYNIHSDEKVVDFKPRKIYRFGLLFWVIVDVFIKMLIKIGKRSF